MALVSILAILVLFYYLYKAFFTSWNKTYEYDDQDDEEKALFWERKITEALKGYKEPKITRTSHGKVFKELGSAWSESERAIFLRTKQQLQDSQKQLEHLSKEKKEKEKKNDGLVILNARYGVFDPNYRLVLDVTIPMQCFVNERTSTLSIQHHQNLDELPGFCNPAKGLNLPSHLTKELHVIFRTNGSLKMKNFALNDQLRVTEGVRLPDPIQ